jgi:hypothetical protein
VTSKRRSLCLVFALLTFALAAHAEPSASERETARTLVLSGRAKRKAGHLREALADFERAHGIMHVPTTGLDLGKAQVALGMLVEGRATLLESAHYPATPGEPHAFTKARQEARQLAEEVAPRLATLTISVRAGAKVKIDDAELSASSIDTPLKMNPGKHEIVASIEGGKEKRATIELLERENKSFAIDLDAPDAKPAPPPPPPPPPPPKEESSGTSSLCGSVSRPPA